MSDQFLKYMWTIAERSYNGFFPSECIKDNDRCVVHRDQGKVVIAFAGSNDLKDWISNFRVRSLKEHKDFEKSFNRFKKYIDDIIGSVWNREEIYVTGHSRGGALATQCAEYIAKMGIPCSCIAFASPKVGGKTYREMYNKLPINHTIIRNGWDIVTYLPHLFYRHVGKVVRIKQRWWHRLMFFRVRDHLPKSYAKAVHKYYEK